MAQNIDVTQVVDGQRIGALLIGVMAVCILVTLTDGYNISVASFAAPGIVKAFHIDRAALGGLFSSSLIAGLIGPFAFGALADRIGRRHGIILSTVMFGVFGLVSGLCTSLEPLIITRFIAGVGMSGALAVTVATVNEFAPRRLRATCVTIVFSGTTIGSGLPGLVAPPLVAHYGWQSLFFVGGIVPLALAAAVYFLLPESPKFLCLRSGRSAALERVLRRMQPQLSLTPDSSLVLGGEAPAERSSHAQLFQGRLALLTPLLWLGAFLAMIVFHSFNSWLTVLLPDTGMSYAQATHTVALFQFVGTLGGWVIMQPLDRFGMLPCTILYVLAIPLIYALGAPGLVGTELMLMCAAVGFCVLGLHFAQVSCVSNVYPTSVRALGVGWFMLFARVGGAVGPWVVGQLVAQHVPLRHLFQLATVPLAVGTVASIAVTVIYQAYYQRKPPVQAPGMAGGGLENAAGLGRAGTLEGAKPGWE
jgi:MFS transporter, AAHS family, 4-hydroxybenzoate transporter